MVRSWLVHLQWFARHRRVDNEFGLKWRVLHYNSCVLHDPFAILHIKDFLADFKAVSKLEIVSRVVDRHLVFVVPLFFLSQAHEFAVRGKVNTFGRKQFWSFDSCDWALLDQ